MRKITEKAIFNFNNNFSFSSSNTNVKCAFGKYKGIDFQENEELTIMSLHGNDIAIKCINKKTGDERLYITNSGYFSNTTKERLNGLKCVNIYQKRFKWYLNDKLWNGNLIRVK